VKFDVRIERDFAQRLLTLIALEAPHGSPINSLNVALPVNLTLGSKMKDRNVSHSADYAIHGFLYQVNKAALEIHMAQDEEAIRVEGIIEDIKVASKLSLAAI
jgi:hypothetical protein